MTGVIQRLDGLDIEAGVGCHVETLATFEALPRALAGQFDAAFAGVDFHDFRCAGGEGQCRWKNHAQGFFAAVGKRDRVRHAFAIEVQVGFFADGDVGEVVGHDGAFKGQMMQMKSKRPEGRLV
ncbi:MAG: hypothetical protein ACI802_002026 [Candidatus Paceibacteria bacterium]|jgi:hypothetical protein